MKELEGQSPHATLQKTLGELLNSKDETVQRLAKGIIRRIFEKLIEKKPR